MFPFALLDDAAQQIEKAADAVVAAADANSFENVKFPVSMDVPDRGLDHAARDADGIKFASDEYAFMQQTRDNDVSLECWNEQSLAQRFITNENTGNRVRKITLTLNRIGAAYGNLTAHIHADNSGAPASSALGSSSGVGASKINAKGNVTFTFGTEITLVKNTPYWIVLTSMGTSTAKVVWYCKTSSPDANYPAAVKVGSGSWTHHPDKNMTYILIGYYATGRVDLPVHLVVGPEYQAAYFAATVDENSSITLDIKNADTGDTLYANLTDGHAVALNPNNTPNLKIIANLTRDPGLTLAKPVLSAIGFAGRAYQSKYQFVDRDFRPTAYSKHVVAKMGLVRTSGGLKLMSDAGTLKENSGPGYVDNSTGYYYVNGTGQKLTQLYYTDVPVTITGFRMRVRGANAGCSVSGGVWLSNAAGLPGDLQGSLTDPILLGVAHEGVWKTVILPTPVEIPADTYFHAGIQYGSGIVYASSYATAFEGLHVTAGAADIYRTVSYAMDLYGKCASANVSSELILPGVKEHGLVYPLAYLPDGAEVSMAISDPLTGMPFHTLQTGEKCSLALLPTELFNRIKMVTTLKQALGRPGPVVGVCYTYTGSEMAPEPVKRYKIMTYTFAALEAAGNYLTINGRGKVLSMSISGSTEASVYGDGHKLTLDDLNVAYLQFYNVTLKTMAYLDNDFIFKVSADPPPTIGFEFSEKLSWDLTEYQGSSNGGSITVALEV